MKATLFAISASLLSALGAAQSTFFPARPPAVPLAVKSPYLSVWLPVGSDGGDGGYIQGETTTFWDGVSKAWTGLIRVDGTTYTWMGLPGPTAANQTSMEYTSTKSIFTLDVAGAVTMNLTFSSPIFPDDFMRQSLVWSYLDVSVQSSDGAYHDVELYADITGEWASGDPSTEIQWEYGTTGSNIAYHKVFRQTQLLWSEINDQAEWGYWYWATEQGYGYSYESGCNQTLRSGFAQTGSLNNTQDTDYRAINDSFPAFAFAKELGKVGPVAVSTLFTIGLAQEQAIQYDSPVGNVSVPSLWTSYFDSDVDALEFHYTDYEYAFGKATEFDDQVATDSIAAAGQDYLTITSLAARQAIGSTQLTGNKTNMYLFLKEISSDGNVQTVDVIFPFHPFLVYTNPTLIKLLLEPLFENQESGQYPNKYSMHDLGSSYPNATGHPLGNDEMQPLEECGNMLIMTLAYAQRTQDVAFLHQHYDLLKQWTGYLVNDSLIPMNQISTDDFAGALANQTNLALKGIIGIEAMAVIANLTGNFQDGANFTNISHVYIDKWQGFGIAQDANPPHTTLGYGLNNTHGLLYNLYGDRELNLNLVPEYVYQMQSNFYPTVELRFGVPLDTRGNYTKADWEMFCAAIANNDTQQMFVGDLAKWINETPTNLPFSDLFYAIDGDFTSGVLFTARPVMGGAFALLALQHQNLYYAAVPPS